MIDGAQKKRATRFVLLTVFTYSMGFGIIMPVLPGLIVELEGVTLARATLLGGFIAATYAVFQFLMGPLVGNLGDRFGRRPVFLLSLFGFGIDFFVMGFAQNIVWLFVGRAFAGGLGAIFGPANSAMADMSSDEDRAKGFGLVGAAFGIGFICGPALGGLLGDFGNRVPFFLAGTLALMTFVYGYFAFPETMKAEDQRSFSLKRANPIGALLSLKKVPSLLGVAVVYFLWMTSSNLYPASWAYFAPAQYGWEPKMVGFSLTLVGISLAVAQIFLIGRMVNFLGERKTALIGMTVGITGMLLFANITNPNVGLLLCALVGIQGMTTPCVNALMSRRTPADMQGELQGFNGSMAALSAIIAPLIYNPTLSYFTSSDAPFRFAGAPFVLASFVAVLAMIALFLVKPVQSVATQ